ncbi:MAG TPA: phosphoenolpyruvate--protein phosphotransferase [Lachnospiraceae bacterium]|nr:phosphoenolpyruvate--protein phosphotransferase [Lachnospiraceae bacterium]
MELYQGKSVFKGVAIGKILVYQKKKSQMKRVPSEDSELEMSRFREAKRKAISQIKGLYQKAVEEIGTSGAGIFEVHQMMLEDLDYLESIENMICNQKINAEYAVAVTGENFYQMFLAMEDDYMKGRAADIKDVSERVVNILSCKQEVDFHMEEAVILLADDLAPSETLSLDKSKVLSFVTRYGSTNSHAAILARAMNIPSLVGVSLDSLIGIDGRLAIVDGFTGMMYIDPDEETLQIMKKKQMEEQHKSDFLRGLKGKENITLDGKKINLYGNIGGISDVASVLQNDAGGIGLYRSEFLYLQKDSYPTEEELFQEYKAVAEKMDGKKVIIRTLDIGADKQVDYFNLDKEENPALGYRAIRICLDRKDIFKTQLRALLRASMYGTIAIMYPMIISLDEVFEIKKIVQEVKEELKKEKVPFVEVEQGIMIETPAAAMISDLLAKEVDFFSIGTNDLTQYTLAMDRQNSKLDKLFNVHHPAILRFIKMIVDHGHAAGIGVGICGELASDLELTETFLKMGVDELSVSPTFILELRKRIRELDLSQ